MTRKQNKAKMSDIIIVSEAVRLADIPKSSVTKFCREKKIDSRLAEGNVWLINRRSLLDFKKKSYHPRFKRRKASS